MCRTIAAPARTQASGVRLIAARRPRGGCGCGSRVEKTKRFLELSTFRLPVVHFEEG